VRCLEADSNHLDAIFGRFSPALSVTHCNRRYIRTNADSGRIESVWMIHHGSSTRFHLIEAGPIWHLVCFIDGLVNL
jgi:hypothetical protein